MTLESVVKSMNMTPSQKEDYLLGKLGPYGESKNGAKRLAGVSGIVELLEKETLPPITGTRPPSPNKERFSQKEMGLTYRMAMCDYLAPLIKLPSSLTCWTYKALADYWSEKAATPGGSPNQQG